MILGSRSAGFKVEGDCIRVRVKFEPWIATTWRNHPNLWLAYKNQVPIFGPNFFLVCSSSFGVVVLLMVLLLLLWCYSSFGSDKCHSYFMSLTLF